MLVRRVAGLLWALGTKLNERRGGGAGRCRGVQLVCASPARSSASARWLREKRDGEQRKMRCCARAENRFATSFDIAKKETSAGPAKNEIKVKTKIKVKDSAGHCQKLLELRHEMLPEKHRRRDTEKHLVGVGKAVHLAQEVSLIFASQKRDFLIEQKAFHGR